MPRLALQFVHSRSCRRLHRALRSRETNLALLVALLLLAASSQARRATAANVEAYAGEPFGVARVTLTVGRLAGIASASDERLTVRSATNRALYPVSKDAPVRRLLRNLLEIEGPSRVTVYFLFRGDEPFEATAFAPSATPLVVRPARNPAGHARLLDEWWQCYGQRWQQLDQDPQFPPVVENFLAASLARRLGKSLPESKPRLINLGGGSKGPTVWDELLANERWQLAVDRELLAGEPPAIADQPLPAPMPWYELELPGATDEIAVEPLALHVPAECFYLRFGTFSNYLWFRDLTALWRDDLGNMIFNRSIRRGSSDRIQQQLSLRETQLSKILGPKVISDVAIVGLDPYATQGGAIGMLFQAKNSFLLGNDLKSKRREALDKFPDATETEVEIAGTKVSLISTPGGEVRSYYAQDGDFHLVATSRRLIQRFIEAGQGTGSLAASPGFLSVRQQIPPERGDTVFVYAAPEMFRELTSPATWIAARRRVRSYREAKLLTLARLQAGAKGVAANDRAALIDGGYLPAGFGARFDDTALVENAAGIADSVRGTPGYYLPTSDEEVTAVTAAEAAAYRSFAERFRQECGQLPPIAAAVSREPRGEAGGETLRVTLLATPLDRVKLGKAVDIIGEPSNQRIAWLDGDLINVEVVLDSLLPSAGPPSGQHQLFIGVRDFSAELELARGRLGLPLPENRQGMKVYWGSWPRAGLLGLLGELPAADGQQQVDAAGRVVARRDDLFVGSFSPELVREILPELTTEAVEQPAQAWLRVGNLAGTELEPLLNKLAYSRIRDASAANSRLLNALSTQLHVPAEECREVAEQLMDGTLICPLGGEYQLSETAEGLRWWSSTEVAPANWFLLTDPPADYQMALLSWFEGAEASGRINDDEIAITATIDMAASALPAPAAWELPAVGGQLPAPPPEEPAAQ